MKEPTHTEIDTNAAAKTGLAPAFMVAIEQNFPDDLRIIQDDLTERMLPFYLRLFVGLTRITAIRDWVVRTMDKQVRGIWSGLLCRKCYTRDKLTSSITEPNSFGAVVNLGAGYDALLYRLTALGNIPAWEVDQSTIIKSKRKGLSRALGQLPKNFSLVPINFVTQELSTVLREYGYRASSKTFFIWEAVSQYLTEEAVRKTFDFLSHSPSGSRMAFTYVLKDFIDGKNMHGEATFFETIVEKEKLWHFGFNPNEVADFLDEYGWRFIEDVGYEELNEKYVVPTGRNLPFMTMERVVYAEKV